MAKHLLCNFCGKGDTEVKALIAGTCVYICNECVEMCQEIIDDKFPGPVVWHSWPSARGGTAQYLAFQGGKLRAEICIGQKGYRTSWRLRGRDANYQARSYEAARLAAEAAMKEEDERATRARRESAGGG